MAEKYSRTDEHNLPDFKSHDEARRFLKEKHGRALQLVGKEEIDGEMIYFYDLILNREVYVKGMNELIMKGHSSGLEFLMSSQRIEIWEDGRIHMIH
ncbi:hypothetical protein V7124_19520 [Neobacillus niacini]|uniref:hypothetical protein n=1 Tax=Neobacillus niacini TaxID=86668 RepID=UPI002FFFEE11